VSQQRRREAPRRGVLPIPAAYIAKSRRTPCRAAAACRKGEAMRGARAPRATERHARPAVACSASATRSLASSEYVGV